MRVRNVVLTVAAAAAAVYFAAGPGVLHSQTNGPALAGQVSSAEEGNMEGVLVTAKRTGSVINITVVSDDQGRFSFPRTRIESGAYTLKTRAVGYDLDDPGSIEVTPDKSASVALQLHKTQNLAAQLTNSEWLQSMPNDDKEKDFLLNCVQCHTLERILRSKHTEEEFMKVMQRMGSYANQSFPLHIQKRMATRLLEVRGEELQNTRARMAKLMASNNLSNGPAWPYQF